MAAFSQGDIVRIAGFKNTFMIISKNAFIKATGVFHVCPVLQGISDGPFHIAVKGKKGSAGKVICEQIKLIDPQVRNCVKADYLSYKDIMEVSDVIQGIFEYD